MSSRRGRGKPKQEEEEEQDEEEEDEDQDEEEDGSEEEEEEDSSGSDEDDDDEDDDSEEDDEVPFEESLAFGREKRATQGKRMQTLVGEEQEKDDAFWGDEKWKEDDAESEYSNESESADDVDSDFDAEEAAESEGEDSEAEAAAAAKEKRARAAAKAKGAKYKEPARPKLPRPVLSPEEEARLQAERREAAKLRKAAAAVANADRAKRVSTQQKTAAAAQERVKRDREQAKQRVLAPPKPRATKCTFTQEELLLEACGTERENAKWLLGRKRMQDETDDATGQHAPKRQGKLAARFISRRGCPTVVNFPQVEDMPAVLRDSAEQDEARERRRAAAAAAPRGQTKCAVTGLLARYRDPQTGLPYANAEAFRALRANPREYLGQQARLSGQRVGGDAMEVDEEDEDGPLKGGGGGAMSVLSRVSSQSSYG